MTALFSVVVTTHRRPQLLERALRALRFQTTKEVEVVLCADEGSGETKRVATKYLTERDIFIVLPFNRGPAETRNAGVHAATGKYICFLDDDDTFHLDFLSRVSEFESDASRSLVFFNYQRVVEQRFDATFRQSHHYIDTASLLEESDSRILSVTDCPLGSRSPAEIMVRNFIPNNSFVIRSIHAKRVAFDTHLVSHEDWDYLIALTQTVEFKHLDIYGPRVHFAVGEQKSRNMLPLMNGSLAVDYLSIYRKWPANDSRVRSARRKVLLEIGLAIPPELL